MKLWVAKLKETMRSLGTQIIISIIRGAFIVIQNSPLTISTWLIVKGILMNKINLLQ